MDDNQKKLEKLVDSAMRDMKLDVPPSNFTERVMDRIEAEITKSAISYKPLMSKKMLILIGVLFLVLIGYPIVTGNFSSREGWFDRIDLAPWLSKVKLPSLEMDFSNIMVYGVVFFGMMVLIQITMLKGYFDRKLT
ncbi:sigma-E factor negative regulatory protein [Allomuricauda sp. SCSIO 65647]|uniref:sigma-E factor negative regulatory protein n=1 Tax=Allomuricauda sp. SCSIO 65647 TaxID=2908843 RepID=UPI001F27AA2C|nr:sigma-E factor negative regulatory protein [Muricauda sp. SCSIO 65647]UJH68021.1 sigma-E factor negative regulatory protein [Muricauda sp. SCSIO 65647]